MKRLFFILMMVILCQGSAAAQEGLQEKEKAIKILSTVSVLPVGMSAVNARALIEATIDTRHYVVVSVTDWEILDSLERMSLPEELEEQKEMGTYLMTKLGVDAVVLICGKNEELYAVWVEQACTNGMCTIVTYPYNWRKN